VQDAKVFWLPYIIAAIVLIVFYLAVWWSNPRKWRGTDEEKKKLQCPWAGLAEIVEGADERASTSKLQFHIWTAVAAFAFLVVEISRAFRGFLATAGWSMFLQPLPDIPYNLLVATGLSATTLVAAKAITTSKAASGEEVKKTATEAPKTSGWGAIFSDDSGFLDLSKIQLMLWTCIGVGVYLLKLMAEVSFKGPNPDGNLEPPKLPDIDPVLMVLMGVGQAAYLGKKLTTSTTPGLSSLSTERARVGEAVTVSGTGFGDMQRGSRITANDKNWDVAVKGWQPEQITFFVAASNETGAPWRAGDTEVVLGVVVNGQAADGSRRLTVYP
jgi:hypothetical protein